jgi:sec-independent protein translocase protein TatA
MPFGKIGPLELGLVLLIVIAIFGAGKLASLGGALGRGVKDFRSSMKDGQEESEKKDEKTEAAEAATEDKSSKKE